MSYTRVNWQNAPSTATPVNAENLNTMDKGIADAHSQLAEIPNQLASKVDKVEGKGLSTNDFTDMAKEEVGKIRDKADKLEVAGLNNRIDQIITTPAEGITEQEIIDARQGMGSLGANITSIKEGYAALVAEKANNNLLLINNFLNGNGLDGTNGWDSSASTALESTFDGIRGTSTSNGNFSIINTAVLQGEIGDKIYIRFIASSNSGKPCGSGSATTPLAYPDVTFNPTTVPTRVSYITTLNITSNFTHRFYISAATTGDTLTIGKALHINLTKAYGAGNEPTKEQMDYLLDKVKNNWFDSAFGASTPQGDINAESISNINNTLKNMGVQLTNKLNNGDFSNGTNDWVKTGTTGFVVNNGIAEVTATAFNGGITQYGIVEAGHVYYLKGDIKSDSNLVRLALGSAFASHSGSSEFETLSLISTATAAHGQFIFDKRTSGWTTVYIKNMLLIDLTEEFGAGNEPTKEQMDYLLDDFDDRFFMGTKTVYNARRFLPLWLKNLEGEDSYPKDDIDELRFRQLLYPDYIRPMLNDVAERVRLVQNENTFSFGFITDTHSKDDTMHHCGTIAGATKYIPLSFIAHGGDITDGFLPKPEEFKLIRNAVNRLLESDVPLLYTKGNHDDNNFYGRGVRGGATPYLTENFTKDIELYNQIVKFSERHIVVGSKEELYYYYDDEDSKVRTIIWNSFDIPWVDNDGVKSLSCMHNNGLNNNQLNWIANEALNFRTKEKPEEWGVILISHYANSSVKNIDILTGILDAFESGTTYQSSGNFTHVDDNTGATLTFPYSVDADFTDQAPGEIITFVSGDIHMDKITTLNGYRSIVVLNASLAKDQASAPVKTNFTETETAWDIITIDRVAKTINMTRFGAGSDRSTTY